MVALAVSFVSFLVSFQLWAISKASADSVDRPFSYLRHKSNRRLIPHPPPMPHHKGHSKSSGYHGCLGLSDDEITAASSYFGDDIIPCAVYVNDTLVAGSGSESSSGSLESGGSSSGHWWSGGGWSGGGWFGGDGSGSSSGSGGGDYGGGNGGGDGGGDEGGNGGGGNDGGNGNGNGNGNEGGGENGGGGNGNDRNYGNDDDGGYSNPLVFFDLTDCGSYSNIWLWDLALSCNNSTSLTNCQCTSTEILFQYGTLQCPETSSDAPSCPSDCPVCHTCMQLMGCIDKVPYTQRIPVNIPVNLEKTVNRTIPIALGIAAAVVTVAAGVAAHKYKTKYHSKSVGTLDSALVDEQSESTVEIDIAGNAHVL